VQKREFNGHNYDTAFRYLAKAGFDFAHTYGNAYEKGYLEAAQKYGFKDEIQLEFYEGFVYTIMTQMEPGEYNGKPITTTNSREDIHGHE
jgi:hypothetical protein